MKFVTGYVVESFSGSVLGCFSSDEARQKWLDESPDFRVLFAHSIREVPLVADADGTVRRVSSPFKFTDVEQAERKAELEAEKARLEAEKAAKAAEKARQEAERARLRESALGKLSAEEKAVLGLR